MGLGADRDGAAVDALAHQLLLHLVLERRADFRQVGKRPRRRAAPQHRARARRAERGEPHAERRQHTRQRMEQHRLDAERIRHQAGMLPAGAAERIERIVGDVIAALHRDVLDRIRHVLDRDVDEAVGDLFRRAAVAELARRAP